MFDAVCGGAEVLRVIKFVWTLLDIVLFIVPMALIVMVSIDFGKNVIAGRDDEMKKNMNLAIKRIIFCVALFLVEPICSFAINLVSDEVAIETWRENGKSIGWAECIDIAIDPGTNFEDYEIDFNEKEKEEIKEDKTLGGSTDGAGGSSDTSRGESNTH